MFAVSTLVFMKDSYHHGDLRNALVEAGLRLVEQGGSEGFSLREAARSLGVTASAAYRHFADKSSLLMAIATHGFDLLSEQMLAALVVLPDAGAEAMSAPVKLRAVARAYVALAVARPELFRLMFGAHGLRRIMELRPENGSASAGQVLGAILDQLVAEGRMSPAARVGALLRVWATVHGFAMLMLDRLDGLDTDKDRDRALGGLIDFVLTGLCDLQRP